MESWAVASLASAILLRAVEEWDDPKKRSNIEEFLESELFEEITELLNLDAQNIRYQLREGTYQRVSIRAEYRNSKKGESRGYKLPSRLLRGPDPRTMAGDLGSDQAVG